MSNIEQILDGYHLTTAEIIYRLPDHPQLLQSFIWQEYDLPPKLPKLQDFLDFWLDSIEGRLHSVRVAWADHCVLTNFNHANFLEILN